VTEATFFVNLNLAIGFITIGATVAYVVNKTASKLSERISTVESQKQQTEHQLTMVLNTINLLRAELSDLKIAQAELRIILIGSHGQNGLKSEVQDIKEDLQYIRQNGQL